MDLAREQETRTGCSSTIRDSHCGKGKLVVSDAGVVLVERHSAHDVAIA